MFSVQSGLHKVCYPVHTETSVVCKCVSHDNIAVNIKWTLDGRYSKQLKLLNVESYARYLEQ